jgi:hypothetical protein
MECNVNLMGFGIFTGFDFDGNLRGNTDSQQKLVLDQQ